MFLTVIVTVVKTVCKSPTKKQNKLERFPRQKILPRLTFASNARAYTDALLYGCYMALHANIYLAKAT
jgi:hypothetical protein